MKRYEILNLNIKGLKYEKRFVINCSDKATRKDIINTAVILHNALFPSQKKWDLNDKYRLYLKGVRYIGTDDIKDMYNILDEINKYK